MLLNQLKERFLYGLSLPVIKAYTGTCLSMDVEQKSLFSPGAKIIAPNHPTVVDPFIMASLLKHQSYILITDVAFKLPVMGNYLRGLGHIPVIPGRGQEAVNAALEHLKAGHTIMIFPEGANSPFQGGYQTERSGVARLALASGAPVYPVGIYLQRDRVQRFQSMLNGEPRFTYWYLRGPYAVTIGHAMRFSGSVADHLHVKDIAHQIMLRIMQLAAESQQRWLHNHPPVQGVLDLP